MTVVLNHSALERSLERAYLLAIGDDPLPEPWVERAERLRMSPSVAFIAGVGAVLLARATDARIDPFVLKTREGSAGAFNLRAAASVLSKQKRAYSYDIGSSSDKDPINHSTLNGYTRWDLALDRITESHRPFFQLILSWLSDVRGMSEHEATLALAAYLRVRRGAVPGAAAQRVPRQLTAAPPFTMLIGALDGFLRADTERGARGMALVAATYRTVGFEARLPSRNDPRKIDVPILRDGQLHIATEVKQTSTGEAIADTLAHDADAARVERAVLAVLAPGVLTDFDRSAVIRRAETEHGVILRIVAGTRELLHEALTTGDVSVDELSSRLPRAFAEALVEIRVADQTIETWAAIAESWE